LDFLRRDAPHVRLFILFLVRQIPLVLDSVGSLPFADKWWSWLGVLIFMLLLVLAVWYFFKRRKML